MDVSAQNFPTVFKAFHLIELDNGGINRMSPKKDAYVVPDHMINQLPVVEQQLLKLTGEGELDEFCNGEHADIEALTAKHGLEEAGRFLNLFFDDWIED